MMIGYIFERMSLVAVFFLIAWTAEAGSNSLRGMTVTQIEDEPSDPEPSILPPPFPSPPGMGEEFFFDDEDNEDDTRSRSKHGAKDFSMENLVPEARIIDGQLAEINKYPYYALMIGFNDNGGMFSRGCGATHIEPEWILTAAHCNCRGGDIAWIGGYGAASKKEQAKVAECFPHPKYRWPDYDITVCRLEQPYYDREMVKIAEADYELEKDQPLTVIGTGRTKEDGPTAKKLYEAIVPYQEKKVCDGLYGSFEVDHMVCAGGGTTDACQGDSGGPLFYEDNGEFFQAGIVSWGSGCGNVGKPGVYAGVIEERNWIKDTICENSENSVASICSAEPSPTPPSPPPPSPSPPSPTTPTSNFPSMVPSAIPSAMPSSAPVPVPAKKPEKKTKKPKGRK